MAHEDSKMMTGLFRDRSSAERAFGCVTGRGYTKDDVSLLMSPDTRNRYFPKDDPARTELGTRAAEGAGVGQGDAEGGAPTILLEAQAIGTPVVTTRHADIPHVVPEGTGVYLCAEHDVDALGEALVAALMRPEGSSAAHVTQHHDVRQAIDRLEDTYLLAAKRLPLAATGERA